jgi:hypothetical protein
MTIRSFLLLCLLPLAIYAGDLQGLVSASNDFEVEMIERIRLTNHTADHVRGSRRLVSRGPDCRPFEPDLSLQNANRSPPETPFEL